MPVWIALGISRKRAGTFGKRVHRAPLRGESTRWGWGRLTPVESAAFRSVCPSGGSGSARPSGLGPVQHLRRGGGQEPDLARRLLQVSRTAEGAQQLLRQHEPLVEI